MSGRSSYKVFLRKLIDFRYAIQIRDIPIRTGSRPNTLILSACAYRIARVGHSHHSHAHARACNEMGSEEELSQFLAKVDEIG